MADHRDAPGLADAAAWRDYLSDRRLAFFRDVMRFCNDAGVTFDRKRVGDAGSGTGYLLRLIEQQADEPTLFGYDTFDGVQPLAGAICPSATFETCGIDEISTPLDVVFCTEVLEHLVDPESALQRLADLVRADRGVVVITVPDGRTDQHEAGAAREDGTAYWGHIHFWSPESWPLFIDRALGPGTDRQCGRTVTGEN